MDLGSSFTGRDASPAACAFDVRAAALQAYAFGVCPKCFWGTGGATSTVAGLTFWTPPGTSPAVIKYEWVNEGILLDSDGSLLTAATVAPDYWPGGAQAGGFSPGAGATLHSDVNNDIFDRGYCTYMAPNT